MADDTPKAINKVYPYKPGDSTDKAYVQRYIRGDAELDDIAKKGHALPKEGGKDTKYWTAIDEPNTKYPENTRLVRVARENVLPDQAVRAEHIELHDPKSGKWGPIKGGGGSGGVSDTREMQLGADLDPKSMMKRSGYKKGGAVKSASFRGDGIAQRGKTKGRMR
jgi:hypothetical protein